MMLELAWLIARIAGMCAVSFFVYDQTDSIALVLALLLLYGRSEAVHAWQRYWELMDDARKESMARIRKKWQEDMKKDTEGPHGLV